MKKERCKKGEITAFLSLVFVLFVSFILAMTESAQIQTEKNLKRLAVDRSVYSVFGEYQRDLFEEYGVFAIEGTYETGSYEEQLLLNRLAYYGSGEIDQSITDIQYLSDNGGQAFREQVLAYMESKSGLEMLEDFVGISNSWESQKIEGEQVSGQLEEIWDDGTVLIPEQEEEIQALNSTSFLSMVLPEDFKVSGKSISQERQLSKRERRRGRGHFPARKNINGIKAKLLFDQYLEEKMNSATEQKSDQRSLDYEIEYLIGGKDTDEENLKEVVKQLLLARFGMNYIYLLSDSNKQAEAETMALAMAAVALHPETKEVIKQLLLLLWAFGESTVEVRSLLGKKKVPTIKTAENWVLPLSSVFTFWISKTECQACESEACLDYSQYLQILLYLKDSETMTMRTLDRIEENMRVEKELEYFTVDTCISKIRMENRAELWRGNSYKFPVYFGYL